MPSKRVEAAAETQAQAIKRPRITLEALDSYLSEQGFKIAFDTVTQAVEITDKNGHLHSIDRIVTVLHSVLGAVFTGCTFETIRLYLVELAHWREYNSVLSFIESVKLDLRRDSFAQLYEMMGVEDALSKTLICKWLQQSLCLLQNASECTDNAHAPAGILLLWGPQYLGKTSLVRKLAMRARWFAEGQSIDPSNKDDLLKITTRWIVELGEIEATLKHDMPRLKAFITSTADLYRAPYAREAESHPRRVSLFASCNSIDFLRDQTGNRRFWTIECTKQITAEELEKFDFPQLWRQTLELVKNSERNAYYLTRDEVELLEIRNGKHVALIDGEAEIRDLLAAFAENPKDYRYISCTASRWLEANEPAHAQLKRINGKQLGRVLRKLGYVPQESHHTSYYNLPIPVSALTDSELRKIDKITETLDDILK